MPMSGLTVRSYVKWAMDPSSFNKVQTQYHGHLAKLQQQGIANTQQTNEGLKNQHKKFTQDLDKINTAAHNHLRARSKQIAQEVEQRAKAAKIASFGGKMTKSGDLHKSYKMDAKGYEASLKIMSKANADYVTRARAMGGRMQAGSGDVFSATEFGKNNFGQRTQLIAMQKEHVGSITKGTAAYRAQKSILDQQLSTHAQINVEEKMRNGIIKENGMLARMSQSMMEKGIIKNNARYREQLQLQMQINQTLDRMKMHISQGLTNAFMVSTIAIMAFTFRLQTVVDTFKEFEKELINAQSIFQTTDDILYGLSDQIVAFGTKYGVSLQDASEGLYTLASAGLSAADSQEVLTNTLKLNMAVQGDHETIAKLTTQTIFGFGLEMSDSAELTDKFAHAINKSLIEYQDLASAVKFAMPFFITTGQNIDQLLGSLEILTNRALEAGIAGRGLRQALSEFAQHADDNTAAFAKLGIEVTDSQGNFLMLTEIAKNFQVQMGEMTNDTELLTTLLEDLNVRGATAFVHLVQNADEFQAAVDDLANSAGSATAMADIQQQSLANQILVVKNALMAPFLLSDEVGKSTGTMNEFSLVLHDMVEDFEIFFIKTMPDGTRLLTEQGAVLRDVTIDLLREFSGLLATTLNTFNELVTQGDGLTGVLHALFMPIKGLVWGLGLLGENGLKAVLMYKAFNMLLPLSNFHILAAQAATGMLTIAETELTFAKIQQQAVRGAGFVIYTKEQIAELDSIARKKALALSTNAVARAQMAANIALFAGFILINKSNPALKAFGYVMLFVAGALTAYAVAVTLAGQSTASFGLGTHVAIASAGAVAMYAGHSMTKALNVPEANIPTADTGRRIYDTGGAGGLGGRHQMVMVEPGETIIPKTQNMLGGASGGITLNIGGDIVTDNAEDFAERIAAVLPAALRRQNDIGGI
tara:strand:+ start:767 stop:3553 length:2787 start_codon:yes stop_codon:yes gene_type:complete